MSEFVYLFRATEAGAQEAMPAPVKPIVSATMPTPDPRIGLSAGRWDAAQAAWNIRMISTTPPGEKFLGVTNSDLALDRKSVV